MEMLDSKSLLAKLMATENLIVEQKPVDTASFDVKNRVLTLPVLDKNISGYLYDLFVAHEVGHALYTPEDGMKKAFDLNLNMSLMNVLEDSRIERKIKNKYPGVRASFVRGYKELIDKDFFGTKDMNLNDLRFIDKVNLFCKGGPTQGIDFTEEEKELIKEVESTVTYDDVIELAKKISNYAEQEQEERKKKIILVPDEDGDEETDEFDDELYDDSEEESDDEEFYVPKNNPTGEEEQKQEENDEVKTDGSAGKGDTDIKDEEGDTSDKSPDMAEGSVGGNDISSKTDRAFEENIKKLFSTSNETYYYADIPDFDLEKIIVPYKELWKEHKEYYATNGYNGDTGLDTFALNKVRQDSTKVVSYLAKEFELRKNADQMKRASIAKTGELNMAKIYSYKFNEDLFKKATTVPNGKSHGLVMFVDWSGSMSDHLEGTIKQLINLALFCRKVLIPFEVYAFSDEHRKATQYLADTIKPGNLQVSKLSLLNFLSSKMSAAEFNYACGALLYTCGRYRPEFMQLGGTPLNETIIAAMKIIPEFKKQYKLQIVNTVFLTDGEGHGIGRVYQSDTNHGGEPYMSARTPNGTMVLRDKKSMQQVVCNHKKNSSSLPFLEMLKQTTGCNIVGFYVTASRNFKSLCYRYASKADDFDMLRSEFRKNNYHVFTTAGYDEYYILRAEGMDTDEEVEFEVKENATTRGLVNAFNKYTKGRLNNRVVLNRFIGLIS